MLNANFEGIRSDADGVTWKWVEKRRLDVPDIALFNGRVLVVKSAYVDALVRKKFGSEKDQLIEL